MREFQAGHRVHLRMLGWRVWYRDGLRMCFPLFLNLRFGFLKSSVDSWRTGSFFFSKVVSAALLALEQEVDVGSFYILFFYFYVFHIRSFLSFIDRKQQIINVIFFKEREG